MLYLNQKSNTDIQVTIINKEICKEITNFFLI